MVFHEFTLTYNKLSKGLSIFGVLSEERAPSSVIIPEPEVLPPTGERGPSSACSPNPECSPRVLIPVLGWKRAEGEETGWWRNAGRREIMKVRLLDYL